jgi:hypothetical protein
MKLDALCVDWEEMLRNFVENRVNNKIITSSACNLRWEGCSEPV